MLVSLTTAELQSLSARVSITERCIAQRRALLASGRFDRTPRIVARIESALAHDIRELEVARDRLARLTKGA